MTRVVQCRSLFEVSDNIDRIDRWLVALIAERGAYVRQAAAFRKGADEIPAPQRVAQVLAKVNALALESGADPAVVEATWTAMIAAFSDSESVEQALLPQASAHLN